MRPVQPFLSLLGIAALAAQEPEPTAGLVAMHQARLDAATGGVVLNIAAHPDDEASRTNTVLRRKHGLRVVTAYSTYGDGGQNAVGKEIGPDLARLRVRETMAAAAMMDVEVRWLGMSDFGFSKTLDETLATWGQEQLLAAMRRVVDEVDPDFVVTNHDLTHGHGHHRASFWAIFQVIEERRQQGLHAPALYSRCSLEDAQWTVDPAELDPVRGETYARLAYRAWTQHVTQGPWGPHDPLQVGKDYWQLCLPAGGDAALAAQPLVRVRRRLDAAQAPPPLGPGDEERAVAALQRLRRFAAPDRPAAEAEARWRAAALQRLLLAAAGVRVESWLDRPETPRGGQGKAYVVVHGMDKVRNLAVRCGERAAEPVAPKVRSSLFEAMPNGTAPSGAEAAPVPLPGRLSVLFQNDAPTARAPELDFVQVDVAFDLVLGAGPDAQVVPVALSPRLAFATTEPIEVRWDRDVVYVPAGESVERVFSASVASRREESLSHGVRLGMGSGLKAVSLPGSVSLSPEHAEARVLVRASIDGKELGEEPVLRLEVDGRRAQLRIVPVEVFVPPGLHVGLVRGPDDTVEKALADLGVRYSALDRDALATSRLEDFSTLLLDMRAYHHVPELAEHRDRILQFCRAGGRVVSMYHKTGEWNERPGHPLLAPFALTVGNDRCTEEDSPVVMLQPQHPIWQRPHQITAQDFVGWVQERGLNFPSKWDPAWTPLLELKDRPDEQPSQGALLHTQYGRGDYVYCSLALYRQLRQGHPGAARILVNLLAR